MSDDRKNSEGAVKIDGVLKDLAEAGLTDKEIAQRIGVHESTYTRLKKGQLGATLRVLFKIACFYRVGFEYLLRERQDLIVERNGPIGWRISHELVRPDQHRQRAVAIGVLRGETRAEIAEELARSRRADGTEPTDSEVARAHREVGWLTRGAISLGFVDLILPEIASECGDEDLARELEDALASVAPAGHRIDATVVPNVAGPDFERDPIAPYVVARVAHERVRGFLARYPYTMNIGIAGGMHLGAFVQTIGPRSSPLLDPTQTDRPFTIVPLTMEPFYDPLQDLADGLVTELARRGAAMLGHRRIEALSFKPFGFLEDRVVGKLEKTSIELVRERYNRLDVAVFGCGSGPGDGWLDEMHRRLGLNGEGRARTDVCLNLLDADGKPILMASGGRRREPLGVDLARIQYLAAREDRLALLLASGAAKGESLGILARAGAMNAVVCDAAAARACINALT